MRHTTVHKFDVALTDSQIIEIPQGAQILKIAMQEDPQGSRGLKLWAHVGNTEIVQRNILIRGTGHKAEIPLDFCFLDTIVDNFSGLIWHAWIGPEREEIEL